MNLQGMQEMLAEIRRVGKRGPKAVRASNKEQAEIVYRAELDALMHANKRFRVVHTLSREPAASGWPGRRGRIDATLLAEAGRGLDDPTYYVCGKPEMVQGAAEALLLNGVLRERIVYELFPGYS